MSSEGKYLRLTGTLTNVGSSEETTLQFPAQGGDFKSEIWLLVSTHFVVTGGSAATFALRIGQSSGWTNGDVNERAENAAQTFSSEPAINDVYAEPIPCLTDSNGRLYFRPGFNTGSDNDANYEFWFRKAKGSG